MFIVKFNAVNNDSVNCVAIYSLLTQKNLNFYSISFK